MTPTTAKELVARLREQLKINEISRRTAIPQCTVSRIASGKIADPRGAKLVALQRLHRELYPEEAVADASV